MASDRIASYDLGHLNVPLADAIERLDRRISKDRRGNCHPEYGLMVGPGMYEEVCSVLAALRADPAPVPPVRGDGDAPEGWVLVPVAPTPNMSRAGDHYTNCGGACGNRAGAAAWAAMLCAAPKFPAPDSQQAEGQGDAPREKGAEP